MNVLPIDNGKATANPTISILATNNMLDRLQEPPERRAHPTHSGLSNYNKNNIIYRLNEWSGVMKYQPRQERKDLFD